MTKLRDYRKAMMKIALKFTRGDREASEDVVQDAMLRVVKTVRNGNGPDGCSDPYNYLVSVVRNTCMDRLRRQHRRVTEVSVVDISERLGTEFDPPDPDCIEPDLGPSREIERLLSGLTDEELTIATMLSEGRTHAEIAEVLGCPVGTARTKLNRLRRRAMGREAAR